MKTSLRWLSVSLLLVLNNLATAEPQPPKGFTAIFNGKDLTGWHGWAIHGKNASPYHLRAYTPEALDVEIEGWTADAKQHWSVQNDELVNDGKGAYLATDKEFGDIELLIEYKTVALADSGIYLRGNPQVQIWDTTKEGGKWDRGADKGSGGLFNNDKALPGRDPLVHADKPFGEWNSFRILMVGERTSVWLNDKLVVDQARWENFWNKPELRTLEAELKKAGDDKKVNELRAKIEALKVRPMLRKGPILLQTHGGEIRWRNIFVREIPSDEANDILRKHADKGFESIFNGNDFAGWAGPIENYDVENGTIICKPKKGGTIYTTAEYDDFVARVEFKLPPGGNNGLAIRYPGKGDTAYVGMCELQVLDDDYEKVKKAKLDARQSHGSAYGMAAAQRGYQRPIGDWNFQEVTVKGSTIKVELNGTVILDCDLSKITEYMAKSAHPGKERTSGHFGFAGHSDPVAFRNVMIKKLEK